MPRLRITDLKVYPCTVPSGRFGGRNFCPIKILTNEPEIYGVGDGSLDGRELVVAELLTEYIKPMLLGRDPDRIEDIWQSIFQGSFWRGGPVFLSAQAAVDMALWDIKGKRAGMPVYDLLGGKCREGCLIYTPAGGIENIRKLMERGVKVFRVGGGGRSQSETPYRDQIASIQSGLTPEEKASIPTPPRGEEAAYQLWDEEAYVRNLPESIANYREELGDEVGLIVDVHEKVSFNNALRIVKELEPFKMFFIEDPLRPEHKEGFRHLRNHTTAPLAMGELFGTKWEFLPLINEQLVDYVRFDMAHGGGITEARKIAIIAEPYYVKTAWHGPVGFDLTPITQAANLSVDYSIHNFGIQEHLFWSDALNEVFPNSVRFREGYLELGDELGLGCDINESAIVKFPFKKSVFPFYRKPDGSVQAF